MRRVLITGGAGCLGANMADRLLAQGAAVLCVDNYATGERNALQPHDNLEMIEGTIVDEKLVDELFDRFNPTHVIHSAASYKDPDNWSEDVATNVIGTANVVKAALRHDVKRFIYYQTVLCYGRTDVSPVPVSHPVQPFTSYAISKTAGEQYVQMSGLPYVSLRLSSVYGPRHYNGPIPTFYQRLTEGKKCFVVDTKRDFIEMEDFLVLMDKVMEDDAPVGVFNVSSGKDVTIKEIFDSIIAALEIELEEPVEVRPPEDDDVASILLDASQTEKAFGWKATTGLQHGLKKQIDWFNTHGIGQTYTHLKIGHQKDNG